ncbi:Six-hairpin glycosidase-like protein [Xylogone sp. PMI_703]|nr:Six-hairpin glycosidase-like protein [Xylogone sp. PMI_703]
MARLEAVVVASRPRFTIISFVLLFTFLTEIISATAQEVSQRVIALEEDTNESWTKYVRSPPSTLIHPVKILSQYTLGNVTNPTGLLSTGSGSTVLSRASPNYTSPTIVIDFGQNVAGWLSINFTGASKNGPGLRLAFSESLEYLTNTSDFTRSYNGDTITPGTDQIAVPSSPSTWTDAYGCKFPNNTVCSDGLHGFRYLKIYLDAIASDYPYTSPYGTVSIGSVALHYAGYLGTPETFTGWFECSDDDLNRYWYDAVYTNDLCTDIFRANDTDPRNSASPTLVGKLVLHDGAKRDRDPYVGDLGVSALTSYLSHDVHEAARDVLADLADHQRSDGWIPPASINNYTLQLIDYPLWWVRCSYNLFVYTGDTQYIEKYYHTIVNVLDLFYPTMTNTTSQLLTKGLGVSGSYGDYAFLPRTGAVTYYNALYVLALDNAASIASFLGGHDDDAARWSSRARNVSAAINNILYDTSVGAFFDSASQPGATHAQDGNSISILSGVANRTRALSVLSFMDTHMSRFYGNAFYDNDVLSSGFSQRVYPFISFFEIAARFTSGIAESALEEIRRLYGWMSANDPFSTFWEGIADNGSLYEQGYTSLAHGWATGIVPALTNYVLGVQPTGPGFSTWVVKPHPASITWARGQVPTPNGAISVNWNSSTATGQFSISVTSPAGTKGSISVPVADNSASVYVDSKLAWQKGRAFLDLVSYDDGYVNVNVTGGFHLITTS